LLGAALGLSRIGSQAVARTSPRDVAPTARGRPIVDVVLSTVLVLVGLVLASAAVLVGFSRAAARRAVGSAQRLARAAWVAGHLLRAAGLTVTGIGLLAHRSDLALIGFVVFTVGMVLSISVRTGRGRGAVRRITR
jgi:hypothetical protein